MSSHNALVTRIKVTPHPDPEVHSLAVGYVFGETVIVGKDTPDGALGLYFPCELQLSEQFAKANDLIRRKNADGIPARGMFEENRRVRIQKFRGVKSHGFWCPLSYLDKFGNTSKLKEGDSLDTFNGKPICNKYFSKKHYERKKNKVKNTIPRKEVCFPEHLDTKQLMYNLKEIEHGDCLTLTNKLHGTSQRLGRVLATRKLKWWEFLLLKLGVKIERKEMQLLNGTRRVILRDKRNGYHSDDMRDRAAARLTPFIEDHMIIYFEVVGYEPSGVPIMPRHDVKKTKDKKLVKQYGETMTYSYGCPEGEHDVYIYRICYVLPDGRTMDFDWDEIVEWCSARAIKYVPEISRINTLDYKGENWKEDLAKDIDGLSDGPDTIDPRHIKEGVCVRINKKGWHTFKHKSFVFRVLENIIKEDENYLDLEELS